jgi:acetylglutamate kinase
VTRPLVLKFGGELLEEPAYLGTIVAAVSTIAASGLRVVVVHGGGKEIDAQLERAGIPKRQVDGLRVTDDSTLEVVVSVLAGAINTRLVAALNAAGVRAVGLTGADARTALANPAPPHRTPDGRSMDLGRVGVPGAESDMRLIHCLLENAFVPVVACIGTTAEGQLLNVNADTLAAHLAGSLSAARLVVAGTTPGVLDPAGHSLSLLESAAIARLVTDGTVTAGMIAKLRACEHALIAGVDEIVIVDGRDMDALVLAGRGGRLRAATRLIGSPVTSV